MGIEGVLLTTCARPCETCPVKTLDPKSRYAVDLILQYHDLVDFDPVQGVLPDQETVAMWSEEALQRAGNSHPAPELIQAVGSAFIKVIIEECPHY